MKTAEITETTIKCDECGHRFAGEVPEWHNKPCPECGQGVLISDADLAMWNHINALVDGLSEIEQDEGDATVRIDVTFDSAGLRVSSHAGDEP